MFHSVFENANLHFIIAFVVSICLITFVILVTALRHKSKFLKKIYTRNRMNTIMFVCALIMGISMASFNNFNPFHETTVVAGFRNIVYFFSAVNSFITTLMLFWFLLMLPFKYFANICLFLSYKRPLAKFLKVSAFYFGFALLAIGISMVQYFTYDPFFIYDSAYSFKKLDLSFAEQPFIYVVARYFLSTFATDIWWTYGIFIAIISLCIIEFIIIKIIQMRSAFKLQIYANWAEKLANKNGFVNYTSPILIYFSLSTALIVQPLGSALHIGLIIMIMMALLFVICFINMCYCLHSKQINFKKMFGLYWFATKVGCKTRECDVLLLTVKDAKLFEGFNFIGKEQNVYNIFSTIIFPLVLTSYLGFSSGELFVTNDIYVHLLFWVSVLIAGYLYTFAYTFNFNNVVSSKMMISMSAAYVLTSYNTGMLNYFNIIIERIANLATFSFQLLLACKHSKKFYAKDNKNKKSSDYDQNSPETNRNV